MRICASQCVSLLSYPVTVYWHSLRGGIHCNIQGLMCVEQFWKVVFNGSGALRTLLFVLRVIHLVTRICGSQGVSQAYSCFAFLDSKIQSDPFLFSNSACHNTLFKHFDKNHGSTSSANAAKTAPKKKSRTLIRKRPRIRRGKRKWEPKEPVEKGKRKRRGMSGDTPNAKRKGRVNGAA